MKRSFTSLFFVALAIPVYANEGLYNTGAESLEALPLKWSLSTSAIYDDNVAAGSSTSADSSLAISPNVGLAYTNSDPQTSFDLYGKVGLIYYLDSAETLTDDTFSQSRITASFSHRFDERLRFRSQNNIANELEPDYSYGIASSRTGTESLSWSTDNSISYRWSERYATSTGVNFSGYRVDSAENNNDRTTIGGYNQIRYQLSQQSVLTSDYRASSTDAVGLASDSFDQFFLVGIDHRFSPSTVGIFKAGAQYRDVDLGDGGLGPYLEIAFSSQINQQLKLGAYTRYSAEAYDTVLPDGANNFYDYEDRRALRLGGTASYVVSPDLSLLTGTDLIFSDYLEGRDTTNPNVYGPDKYETSMNVYVGFSYSLNEFLKANMYYTYAQTFTDISAQREYTRNRISIGLSAEF